MELGENDTRIKIGVSSGALSISFPAGSSEGYYDLTIFSAQGSLVRKQALETGSPTSVNGLLDGNIYFVVLQPRGGGKKIVKSVFLP